MIIITTISFMVLTALVVLLSLGPVKDELCEPGGPVDSEHCHPVHCCGTGISMAGAGREDGKTVQCSDCRLRVATQREEWRRWTSGRLNRTHNKKKNGQRFNRRSLIFKLGRTFLLELKGLFVYEMRKKGS